MANTSVVDYSMLMNLSVYYCLKEHHAGMTVTCVVMLLSFFLGAPVHSWILWFYLRAGWNVKPTQVFFLNHTLLDLIFCIQCALEMLKLAIFQGGHVWSESYIVFVLCFVGRSLMQICICVEQYLAVIHPILFLKYNGIQYRIVSALLVWLTLAGYAIYMFFTKIFPEPFFYFVFLTAVAVISFCCVLVLRALKHPGPGDTQISVERGRDVGNRQKRNAFKTIFSGLLIILFSYLPQASLSLFTVDIVYFHCDIVPVMNSLIAFGVMITPFLKMQREGILKCLNRKRGSNMNRLVGTEVQPQVTHHDTPI